MTPPSKLRNSIDANDPIITKSSILDYVRSLDKEGELTFGKLDIVQRESMYISSDISNLDDLLDVVDRHPYDENVDYNINLELLHRIAEPLRRLNRMVGMHKLKTDILYQVLYYVQGLHRYGEGDFMHVVIYGPPGTGKTEVAKAIGEIFSKLGVLGKGGFRKATRADLVAGFLGQTAAKTRRVVEESLGGVLFIDEAYSLGDYERRDSFAKECLDTLCECLSEHKSQLMVIIAGYEHELKQCFFGYNEGLESRFPWRYETGDYCAEELRQIFVKKVFDAGWSFVEDDIVTSELFQTHLALFKHYGRDMETLFARTKIAHSRRVFGLDAASRSKLTLADIDAGLQHFYKDRPADENVSLNMMYL